MKATQLLHNLGQSLWLDNITRDLLETGTLKRYIDELSVTGSRRIPPSSTTPSRTAPPTTPPYAADWPRENPARRCSSTLRWRTSPGRGPVPADPRQDQRRGRLGVAGSLAAAGPRHGQHAASGQRSVARAARPNLFIKIPGTKEGLPAIEEAIFAGVPVNVTLLFSREQYVAAAEAFLRGIERRMDAGLNPNVGSVASIFISRWDVAVHGQSARRAAQPARHRDRQAHLQGLPRPAQLSALAASLQRRRSPATAPVGQHRDQRSEGFGHPLHQGAGRAFHREHHARRHLEGARRTHRTRARCCPPTAAIARRCWRSSARPASTSMRWPPNFKTKAPSRSSSRGTT